MAGFSGVGGRAARVRCAGGSRGRLASGRRRLARRAFLGLVLHLQGADDEQPLGGDHVVERVPERTRLATEGDLHRITGHGIGDRNRRAGLGLAGLLGGGSGFPARAAGLLRQRRALDGGQLVDAPVDEDFHQILDRVEFTGERRGRRSVGRNAAVLLETHVKLGGQLDVRRVGRLRNLLDHAPQLVLELDRLEVRALRRRLVVGQPLLQVGHPGRGFLAQGDQVRLALLVGEGRRALETVEFLDRRVVILRGLVVGAHLREHQVTQRAGCHEDEAEEAGLKFVSTNPIHGLGEKLGRGWETQGMVRGVLRLICKS